MQFFPDTFIIITSAGALWQALCMCLNAYYIYIYAFSRRFYPQWLTEHSGYTFIVSTCVPWESNPQPFALLMQCSTTEPQEHYGYVGKLKAHYNDLNGL